MPPTTTMASGWAVWPPILVETAAGKRPRIAVIAVIITGRTRLQATLDDGIVQVAAPGCGGR